MRTPDSYHDQSPCGPRASRVLAAAWICACSVLFTVNVWAQPVSKLPAESLVSYRLDAELKEAAPGQYVILGRGTVTLHNRSSVPLDVLPWHLYMNAFAHGSLARQLPFLDSRAAIDLSAFEEGAIVLESLVDGRDGSLLAPLLSVHDSDRTTAVAHLGTPIAVNENASFDVQWVTALPPLSQRTGSVGSFVFAGQWFPKLAKLEADGAWAQFVFHPQAEFYANFGDYDVTLDTPSEYVVGASGRLESETLRGARRVARYVSSNVHDFAWTAWPEFQRELFTVNDTAIELLFPPGHDLNRDATKQALSRALPWLEQWLGPYTLPTLTVVHPPSFAAPAGGMEYPGLITTGGPRFSSVVSDDIERVVIHELAHQWFQGAVASNEYAWPFLDEGLSMYVENRALRELYSGHRPTVSAFLTSFAQYTNAYRSRHDAAIADAAPAFTSFDQLAALAYDRAALVFETLANVYGPSFDVALGQYAQTYAGHHPTPAHLFDVVERHAGVDALHNLRLAVNERGWVNFVVANLAQRPHPDDEKQVLNRVTVQRQGTLSFPVDITLIDAQGQVYHESWNGEGTHLELIRSTPQAITTVCVDPERRIVIDDDPSDNCRRLDPPAISRYWMSWLLALQTLVLGLSW